MKKHLMTISLATLLVSLASVLALQVGDYGVQASRAATAATAITLLPTDGQGVYMACSPAADGCLAALDTLAAAGFTLVINYSQFEGNPTIEQELAFADHANNAGIHIIWSLKGFWETAGPWGTELPVQFPSLGAACACQYNNQWLTYFVNRVKDLPATWGYYIGDEVPPEKLPHVRNNLADIVHAADPNHPRLFVASDPGGRTNVASLSQYASIAEVIAQDFYPVGTGYQGNAVALTDQIAAGVQRVAEQNGRSYGMVLQAHSLSQYPSLYPSCAYGGCPYPSAATMLAMRNAVLQHGAPRLVLWYSYTDLQRSDDYARHWADLTVVTSDSQGFAQAARATQPAQASTITPATPPAPAPTHAVSAPKSPQTSASVPVTQIQIVDTANQPVPNASVLTTANVAVQTSSRGAASIPAGSGAAIKRITVANTTLDVNIALPRAGRYMIVIDPKHNRFVEAYSTAAAPSPPWNALITGALLLALAGACVAYRRVTQRRLAGRQEEIAEEPMWPRVPRPRRNAEPLPAYLRLGNRDSKDLLHDRH